MEKVECIILAAGRSTRMDMDLNKQFLEINGKPVIYYSLYKFLNNPNISKIILVLSNDYKNYCVENVIEKYFSGENIKIVIGGERRQDSVSRALKFVEGEYVMIHDGARPFLTDKCINDGVNFAKKHGASSCYVVPKDTIKIGEGMDVKSLDRDKLLCIQTPQCFKTSILLCAYDYVEKYDKIITDETSALDFIGSRTYFYKGDYYNIKITTKEDLFFGNVILSNILGENK